MKLSTWNAQCDVTIYLWTVPIWHFLSWDSQWCIVGLSSLIFKDSKTNKAVKTLLKTTMFQTNEIFSFLNCIVYADLFINVTFRLTPPPPTHIKGGFLKVATENASDLKTLRKHFKKFPLRTSVFTWIWMCTKLVISREEKHDSCEKCCIGEILHCRQWESLCFLFRRIYLFCKCIEKQVYGKQKDTSTCLF